MYMLYLTPYFGPRCDGAAGSLRPNILLCRTVHSVRNGRSKSQIGATDVRVVQEFFGRAAVNDATRFHDVTSVGN